jgi:NTE family protein
MATLAGVAALAGCASAPLNPRLERPLMDAEVARERPPTPENLNDTAFVLSFSGGGTRAAALAYGVLEALADVRMPGPHPHRLLDEVDLITSVSGGSFTAAYYGLVGDRIFTDFEPRFLRARVGRSLVLRFLSPYNWIRLASPSFDRSDLAAEVYDDFLFHGATFADINSRPGPLIAIQATDLLEGNRFGFSAHTFGLICSDIRKFPIARAVAASAAFPIIFTPIVLRNHAAGCEYYREPPWIAHALAEGIEAGRRFQNARHLHAYADAEARPWIYLVDGGVSDNLGLHRVFDAIINRRGFRQLLRARGIKRARRVVFIIVNAQTTPDGQWGRLARSTPGMTTMLDAVTTVQVNRYNFESLELMRRSIAEASQELAAAGEPPLDSYVMEVSFDRLTDDAERRSFSGIPTTFDLSDEKVDHLRSVARRILYECPEFTRLLRSLGAETHKN